VLIPPSGIKLRYVARLQFTNVVDRCTNNVAKYEAIPLRLHKLRAIGVQTCVLHTDLKVVSSQIEKECIAKEATFEKYLALVRRMESHFKGFTVEYRETKWSIPWFDCDELLTLRGLNSNLEYFCSFTFIFVSCGESRLLVS
jgi:hypothetical protein